VSQVAAALFALVKAAPVFEQVLRQLIQLYVSWKKDRNQHETDAKNSRNDSLINELAAGGLLEPCAFCPYSNQAKRPDKGTGTASPVQNGRSNGS
jgi:biotin synthase-like enzyme